MKNVASLLRNVKIISNVDNPFIEFDRVLSGSDNNGGEECQSRIHEEMYKPSQFKRPEFISCLPGMNTSDNGPKIIPH